MQKAFDYDGDIQYLDYKVLVDMLLQAESAR